MSIDPATLTGARLGAFNQIRATGKAFLFSRPGDPRRTFRRSTLDALVIGGLARWATTDGKVDHVVAPATLDEIISEIINESLAPVSQVGPPATSIQADIAEAMAPSAPIHQEPRTFSTGYLDRGVFNLDDVIADARRVLAGVDFDTIVGTGFSGSVVIPALAAALGKDYVMVRKAGVSSHAGDQRLLGRMGSRFIFVDDFVSSGATRKNVLEAIWEGLAPRRWGPDRTRHQATMVGEFMYQTGSLESTYQNPQYGRFTPAAEVYVRALDAPVPYLPESCWTVA